MVRRSPWATASVALAFGDVSGDPAGAQNADADALRLELHRQRFGLKKRVLSPRHYGGHFGRKHLLARSSRMNSWRPPGAA